MRWHTLEALFLQSFILIYILLFDLQTLNCIRWNLKICYMASMVDVVLVRCHAFSFYSMQFWEQLSKVRPASIKSFRSIFAENFNVSDSIFSSFQHYCYMENRRGYDSVSHIFTLSQGITIKFIWSKFG